MRFLPLALSSFRRRKLRTILTTLSIVVAFILYGYLATIKESLSQGVNVAGADRLIVHHKVSIIQMLPESYGARIARISGVAAVTHATWFGGIYQKPSNFFPKFPVIPEQYLAMYPEFKLAPDQLQTWLRTRTGAVVGRKTAARFGWKIGDRVPIEADIWPQKGGKRTWEFDIVGIYDGAKKGTDVTQFLFRYDYFDEARAAGQGMVGWYIVRVSDPNRAAQIAENIDKEFANSPFETKTEGEGAFAEGFARQIGDIGTIMIAILSAVFFTILLVTGNTMAQSVRERVMEIGVLKALGFSNPRVLALVLSESTALSVIGGWLGLLLAWMLIFFGGDPTSGALPVFYFPGYMIGIGAVIALLLGLVTGIFPALRAMRLPVAESLRKS